MHQFTTPAAISRKVATATGLVIGIGLSAAGCSPSPFPSPDCVLQDGIHHCNIVRHARDDFRDAFSEDVVMLANPSQPNGLLEATVFRRLTDQGKSGLPLAVLNHGSEGRDDPHQQPRYRPTEQAKYFLQRGYLVVAPMRTGFSRSTGTMRFRCDHYDYALRYQADIAATIDHFVRTAAADGDNVVVAGQSNGGVVSLGYAARPNKAKLVINFAGGVDTPRCDWRAAMLENARAFGAHSKLPVLWIYTRTDHIFSPDFSSAFFKAYKTAGGRGEFYLFSDGGHGFSNTHFGRMNWTGLLDEKLQAAGLPWRKQ